MLIIYYSMAFLIIRYTLVCDLGTVGYYLCLVFQGWKKERLEKVTSKGRVILVLPSDPKRHIQKVLA